MIVYHPIRDLENRQKLLSFSLHFPLNNNHYECYSFVYILFPSFSFFLVFCSPPHFTGGKPRWRRSILVRWKILELIPLLSARIREYWSTTGDVITHFVNWLGSLINRQLPTMWKSSIGPVTPRKWSRALYLQKITRCVLVTAKKIFYSFYLGVSSLDGFFSKAYPQECHFSCLVLSCLFILFF